MNTLPPRITYDFRPETKRQRLNRERLAAIIAQGKPAIEAPMGCFNLADAGIKAQKPKKEIFDMTQQAQYANGTAVHAVQETAAADTIKQPQPPKKKRGPKKAKFSDTAVREMHGRYLEIGNLKETARQFDTNEHTLRRLFRGAGLEMLPRGGNRKSNKPPAEKATRQPYTPPSLETLPLSGNGKHAAAARQMVAEAEAEFDWNEPSANMTTDYPAGLRAFLAEAQSLGAAVQVSGEINIRITF